MTPKERAALIGRVNHLTLEFDRIMQKRREGRPYCTARAIIKLHDELLKVSNKMDDPEEGLFDLETRKPVADLAERIIVEYFGVQA